MAEPEKKKGFFKNLFDTQRVGKGVPKEPRGPLNFANFFKIYGRNLTMMLQINLLYVFGNFPFLFALYAMTGKLNVNSFGAASGIFSPLYGKMLLTGEISPATMALFGVHGVQSTVSLMTPATYIFFALSLLIIFTWGPVSTGCTYLIRSLVRGDPIFFFSDFFYAIKRNIRQALPLGIIDCFIYGILTYNIILTYYNLHSFTFSVVFYANIALAFLYSIMRFYIYLMLVTFDLSIWKIFKNAIIFAVLNGKRNLLAISGIAVCILFCYMMFGIFLPLGVLLPFALLFSTCAFMGCYAAYPKVKEVMIDPYYTTDKPAEKEEKPIFTDRG